ncbi:hypothetical protein ZPAH1_orf00105 [Aeromonas phage ZPAH1]|nr:hypothetical protein ZPAH1_orf00105 [Aeromonas phage ZPAH1]
MIRTYNQDTQNEYGRPVCLMLSMIGIKSMLEYKTKYESAINSKLRCDSRCRVFDLWDYEFSIVVGKTQTKYLLIKNADIEPVFVEAISLGQDKVSLVRLVEEAEKLYWKVQDTGFDVKQYFKTHIMNMGFEKEVALGKKIRRLECKNRKKPGNRIMYMSFSHISNYVTFWLSGSFYNPIPADNFLFEGKIDNSEFSFWYKWYTFKPFSDRLKEKSISIFDNIYEEYFNEKAK